MQRWPILIFALLLAAPAVALDRNVTLEGIYHNDQRQYRATLESGGRRYILDFRGADLYRSAERFDRKRAIVRGDIDFPGYEPYPVVYVDSVTFRPFSSPVTYHVRTPVRARRYVTYRRSESPAIDDGYPASYERKFIDGD